MTSDAPPAAPIEPLDRRPAIENCSIAGTLDALGDLWSVLVLRELFFGVHRFNEIQRDIGISRSVLASRLARLVELGIVRTRPYQQPGDRERHEYRLTRKGVGLLPAMISLMAWGDEHLNDGDGPVALFDRRTGEPVVLELRTASGAVVQPSDIEVILRGAPRGRRAEGLDRPAAEHRLGTPATR